MNIPRFGWTVALALGVVVCWGCGMARLEPEASKPIPEELDHLIDLEPSVDSKAQHGPTFINARWDLLRNQLPWLREILELERRWRKRGRIIGRLNARIAELEALPRV